MITTFKIFENLDKPEIGDWVKIKINPNDYIVLNDKLENFINNNYGKIIHIYNEKSPFNGDFVIKFENVPYVFQGY
jgi:hypothetical protein